VILLLLVILLLPIRWSIAEAPTIVKNEEEVVVKPTVSSLITKYASKYGVSEAVMRKVIDCESQYQNIQSRIPKASGPNGREDSWGIVQIHLPDHPNITKAQALDKEFAINFLAKNLSTGKGRMWTCWRKYYSV